MTFTVILKCQVFYYFGGVACCRIHACHSGGVLTNRGLHHRAVDGHVQVHRDRVGYKRTDVGIITSDTDIGRDALKFFNSITTSDPVDDYSCLLVAPFQFKSEIIKFINEETESVKAGKEGFIKLKMNSLTDKDIIEELVKASQGGVKVELIIRGICCLLPGIKDKTENIRIVSVVGRFLEHSRIFIFKNSGVYISSGDMMTRNTTEA